MMQNLFVLFALLAVSSGCDVKVGVFTTIGTLSITTQENFFAAAGLNSVCTVNVPNSVAAYQYLANGTVDLLTGSIDNTLNRVFNRLQNVTALALTDLGPDYIIAGANGVNSIADLRGKSVIVDAVNSGFAYLIQSILLSNGLVLNKDYTFVAVGSTPLRYAALLKGQANNQTVYASLLTYPYSGYLQFANRTDLKVIARASDYISTYAASSLNVQTSSLQNATKVELYTRYLTAYVLTSNLLADPNNAGRIINDLARDLNVSTAVATYQYSVISDKRTGDAALPTFIAPPLAVLTTSNLRQQFGGYTNLSNFTTAGIPKTNGGVVFDYTILQQAMLRATAIQAVIGCPFNVSQKFVASYPSVSGTVSVYRVVIVNKSNAAAAPSFEVSSAQNPHLVWQIGLSAKGYQSSINAYQYNPILLNLSQKIAAGGHFAFDYGSNSGLIDFGLIGC
ncbi:hypothetical protein PROFUN_06835 [Planoprotostelium fungivorum]|uniref:SsuA/THI5-like domain-containing protein n=1 Tax=Planoprotostelium fungivorum TaxID=1890364 RepID=A0A2P6NNE1_9EUKA|nr:hypothetical protein PROFUN_06835 [Planoprotostelium fungivorum]